MDQRSSGKSPEPKDELVSEMPSLKEGEDFYYENGLMVFTEKYHLKRGYCCGSGCRHCPYNVSRRDF